MGGGVQIKNIVGSEGAGGVVVSCDRGVQYIPKTDSTIDKIVHPPVRARPTTSTSFDKEYSFIAVPLEEGG